jgi:hypothetical protein
MAKKTGYNFPTYQAALSFLLAYDNNRARGVAGNVVALRSGPAFPTSLSDFKRMRQTSNLGVGGSNPSERTKIIRDLDESRSDISGIRLRSQAMHIYNKAYYGSAVPEHAPHKRFERQIERIHRLLEDEETEITWDDHIPDPDTPTQPRQIDIALRRDRSLTIIECRFHKNPQDVTWIEELMGRRISLGANAVIAVSGSGFTATAREKAKRYGVILRDIAALSEEEIRNWGRKRKLTINYCEFSQVRCTIKMAGGGPESARPSVTASDGAPVRPLMWRLLFQSIMHRLDEEKWPGLPWVVEMSAIAPILVDGKSPISIELKAKVRRLSEDVSLVSVVGYDDPINLERHAEVGKFDLGSSEIIENCDEASMVIDLSQIRIPGGCCFETVTLDAGRIVGMRPSLIGTQGVINCQIPIEVHIDFANCNGIANQCGPAG